MTARDMTGEDLWLPDDEFQAGPGILTRSGLLGETGCTCQAIPF